MSESSAVSFDQAVLVDAHVHFHACFDQDTFFDCALENTRACAGATGRPAPTQVCLMMTESVNDHYFSNFREQADGSANGRWSFRRTDEEDSLVACRDNGEQLVLTAGRQIATRDGLEVLAVGCNREFESGNGLAEAIAAVTNCGAIPVIPWGFGKWWFRRGAMVADAVARSEPGKLFLGDNGGRARIGPRPRLFGVAEAKGIFVLPGSDPLPFADQVGRVGGYGCLLEGQLDERMPSRAVKELLQNVHKPPTIYGKLETLVRFCRCQVGMQLRKRRLREPP
jgi:hypothetical protein